VYCGVKPHFEATLTISSALPAYSDRSRGWPSMSVALKS
jgi:hypothetical protein